MRRKTSNSRTAATPDTVRLVELAEWLHCAEQEIVRLARTGVLPRTIEKRNRREIAVYPLKLCVQAFVDHQRAPAELARAEYLIEKRETQRVIRAQRELELLKSRGDLIDGEHVDREVMGLFSTIKNHMRAIPQRIASLVLGLKTRAEVQAVMKKAIDLSLREATSFDTMQLRRPSGRNGKHDRNSKTKNRSRR